MLSILAAAPIYASEKKSDTQKTNAQNEIPTEDVSFLVTVLDILEDVTNEIANTNNEQKKVALLVNQSFAEVEKRFLESEKEILEIKTQQPHLATKEWVTTSLNTITYNLNNSVNKTLENLPPLEQLPTKEWVDNKINDTYNSLKQELKEQKEAWEFYKKTKELTLPQDKLSPAESFTIKDYVDASLEKTQETLEKVQKQHNNANWSTRASTVEYVSQHKTALALSVLIAYTLIKEFKNAYLKPSG